MTIEEIAELAHRKIHPNTTDEERNLLEEYIETAKLRYGYRTWERAMIEKRESKDDLVDSSLLVQLDIVVTNNEYDITSLSIMRSLPSDMWLQMVGGIDCDGCKYNRMSINQWNMLCSSNAFSDNEKPVLVIGNKLKFPKGVYDKKVTIIYASNGSGLDSTMEVNDSIGALIFEDLIKLYGQPNAENNTNDSNGNG